MLLLLFDIILDFYLFICKSAPWDIFLTFNKTPPSGTHTCGGGDGNGTGDVGLSIVQADQHFD